MCDSLSNAKIERVHDLVSTPSAIPGQLGEWSAYSTLYVGRHPTLPLISRARLKLGNDELATVQVLDSLSNGGTQLNGVDVAVWCTVLAGVTLVWRIIHYFALVRSVA